MLSITSVYAGEEKGPFPHVAGELGRSLEFGAGLGQSAGPKQKVASRHRQWRIIAQGGVLSRSRAKAEQRYGVQVKAIVIQEAGLDGFWIHRLLLANGIESHVVDAASIAVDRRHRRAKTDAIDGELFVGLKLHPARGVAESWTAARSAVMRGAPTGASKATKTAKL